MHYSDFKISKKLKEIDRNFVELMSGSKFSQRGPTSPKKIQFMKDHLKTDYGFKSLSRVESEMLESAH